MTRSLIIVTIPWAYKRGIRYRAISNRYMTYLLRQEQGWPSRFDYRDIRELVLPSRADIERLPYSNHIYIRVSNHLLTLYYASHNRESHSIELRRNFGIQNPKPNTSETRVTTRKELEVIRINENRAQIVKNDHL